MHDRGRAYKRHHQDRIKAKAKRHLLSHGLPATPDCVGYRANTMTPCSCWMCGNRRKHEGPTIAELRWEDNLDFIRDEME